MDSNSDSNLPYSPSELFSHSFKDKVVYGFLIFIFRMFGRWKYGQKMFGDVERMSLIDRAYWLHKADVPISRARLNSGLEEFFSRQNDFSFSLPEGFVESQSTSLSSVGDLINHKFLSNSKDILYKEVEDLVFSADIPMGNLECPIYNKTKAEFKFSFDSPPPLYYDSLNFNVVKGVGEKKFLFLATACNHSLDFGAEGLKSTVQTLEDEGIYYHGINKSGEKSIEATIIDSNGIRVGFIAWTFGLNGMKPPKECPNIVNCALLNDGPENMDFRVINQQLDFCRSNDVDFIVAHLHWGLEHELYPMPEQVELAHQLAELGVDAIIGHHPHVLQPIEYYRTQRDPNRVVPVYYSLGNLINSFKAPHLCVSGVVRLELSKGVVSNKESVYIKSSKFNQIFQNVDEKNLIVYLSPRVNS